MKTGLTFAALFALFLSGCQKPSEVHLTDDEASLEIEGIVGTDSLLDGARVDTTALLPRDQQNFTGFVTINSVKSDWGAGVRTTVIARVLVVNKARRIPFNDRGFYPGRLLGAVRVNNELMIPRLRIPGNIESGVEYVREISNHQPRRNYIFSADSFGTSLTVESPENLSVTAPVGGERIRRDNDFELRWAGQGRLSLIIGSVRVEGDEVRIVPMLNVRVRENTGRAILSKKVLGLLPRGEYVFTFVVANRSEHRVARYEGKLLMQASSIHNVRVGLI